MEKNKTFEEFEASSVLWHDRKRILGMPLSFTVYEVDDSRFTTRKGFFRTETDEILLYRILDLKLVRTFGQKLCGVGSITLYSADQSNNTFVIKNIKKPEQVWKFLSRIVERERAAKGITGREIVGAAGMLHDTPEQAEIAGQIFSDINGDGIPD